MAQSSATFHPQCALSLVQHLMNLDHILLIFAYLLDKNLLLFLVRSIAKWPLHSRIASIKFKLHLVTLVNLLFILYHVFWSDLTPTNESILMDFFTQPNTISIYFMVFVDIQITLLQYLQVVLQHKTMPTFPLDPQQASLFSRLSLSSRSSPSSVPPRRPSLLSSLSTRRHASENVSPTRTSTSPSTSSNPFTSRFRHFSLPGGLSRWPYERLQETEATSNGDRTSSHASTLPAESTDIYPASSSSSQQDVFESTPLYPPSASSSLRPVIAPQDPQDPNIDTPDPEELAWIQRISFTDNYLRSEHVLHVDLFHVLKEAFKKPNSQSIDV